MSQSTEEEQRVVDLTAYRSRRGEGGRLRLPPDPEEAEDLLNEIAHYILMAIRAITQPRH